VRATVPATDAPGFRSMPTVDECATMAAVCKMTIYRLIQAGVLEATRVARSYRIYEDSWPDTAVAVTETIRACRANQAHHGGLPKCDCFAT
jgi:excisionase family DNA binding protein